MPQDRIAFLKFSILKEGIIFVPISVVFSSCDPGEIR